MPSRPTCCHGMWRGRRGGDEEELGEERGQKQRQENGVIGFSKQNRTRMNRGDVQPASGSSQARNELAD